MVSNDWLRECPEPVGARQVDGVHGDAVSGRVRGHRGLLVVLEVAPGDTGQRGRGGEEDARGRSLLRGLVEGLVDAVPLGVGGAHRLEGLQVDVTLQGRGDPAGHDGVGGDPVLGALFQATSGRSAEVGPADQPVTAALIGGSFTFDRRARELLLDALPPIIHLHAHAESAAMVQHLLSRIDQEARHGRLGAGIVGQHLAVILLIDIIRHHLAQDPHGTGWLHGLSDPVVAVALQAIHAASAERWTVQLLADEAHVSRATLAARFKAVVGLGPLEYLTRWRIEIGAHRLVTTDQTIASIAESVGYGSEAAFALAFKRERGMTPGSYRRSARSSDRDPTRSRGTARTRPGRAERSPQDAPSQDRGV